YRRPGTGASPAREGASGHLGRQLDDRELDVAHQPPGLARVDQTGAEAASGLGPAGHAEAQALVRRAPFVARGQVAGQEGVAGTALGDRLARLEPRPLQPWLSRAEHLGEAS